MPDTRHKNTVWKLHANADGSLPISSCTVAVLMDIRDELQRLNTLLHCRNFTDIPVRLRAIQRNTVKKRKARR